MDRRELWESRTKLFISRLSCERALDLTSRRLSIAQDLAINTKRIFKYCPTNNSRFSLYRFRSDIFELCWKNIIFVKRMKRICLFVCMRSMFFPFGLVFSCSWNGSKCIGVFAIAVRIIIIIIVINTIVIIVAIYIQGTLLVEVDFVIITCRSWNTFPMPCQGFIWFLLLPKHRIKACNLPPNRTALPRAAVWHLRVTYSFIRISVSGRVSRFPSHQSSVCSFCRLRTVVINLRKSRGKECAVADKDAWYWLLYSTRLAAVF